ncbi:hypothetical protein B0H10DRAFT_1941691 [Mycena sp. CBHHK59/15]|nr:hypothetical protein B0H10DRAFT_1941691 [Mycena sp. CBHHK59/15]
MSSSVHLTHRLKLDAAQLMFHAGQAARSDEEEVIVVVQDLESGADWERDRNRGRGEVDCLRSRCDGCCGERRKSVVIRRIDKKSYARKKHDSNHTISKPTSSFCYHHAPKASKTAKKAMAAIPTAPMGLRPNRAKNPGCPDITKPKCTMEEVQQEKTAKEDQKQEAEEKWRQGIVNAAAIENRVAHKDELCNRHANHPPPTELQKISCP